jgi:predicted metal-dependent peptidase
MNKPNPTHPHTFENLKIEGDDPQQELDNINDMLLDAMINSNRKQLIKKDDKVYIIGYINELYNKREKIIEENKNNNIYDKLSHTISTICFQPQPQLPKDVINHFISYINNMDEKQSAGRSRRRRRTIKKRKKRSRRHTT